MPEKAEDLVADRLLEATRKRKGDDHYGHADNGGGNGKPHDES
jgi:hypothetical protein